MLPGLQISNEMQVWIKSDNEMQAHNLKGRTPRNNLIKRKTICSATEDQK